MTGERAYVALLRGINVGGNRKVEMAKLKALCEGLGLRDVRTYINSGNVVFRSDEAPDDIARSIGVALREEFGFEIMVLVRDAANLRALTQALPDSWADGKQAKCDVLFLADQIDSPDVLGQLTIKPDIDDVRYVPGALLWRVERSSITRSGLLRIVGTDLYARMTVRNCNTARKLEAMVSEASSANEEGE